MYQSGYVVLRLNVEPQASVAMSQFSHPVPEPGNQLSLSVMLAA